MKKGIAVIIVLMMVFSFVSCGLITSVDPVGTSDPTASGTFPSETVAPDSDDPDSSGEGSAQQLAWPERAGEWSPPNYADLYEYCGDGVYKISDIDIDLMYPQITVEGNIMLIGEYIYDDQYGYWDTVVYDISSGTVLAHNSFSDSNELFLLSENRIGVINYDDYSIEVYDNRLEQVYSYIGTPAEGYYSCWNISENGEYFVFCDADSNVLNIVELQNGNLIASEELTFKPSYCFNYEEALFITDYSVSSPLLRLDENTLELTEYGNGGCAPYYGGIIERYSPATDLVVSPFADPSVAALIDLPTEEASMLSYDAGRLALCEYTYDYDGIDNMYVVDLSDGMLYYLPRPISDMYGIAVIADGYLLYVDNGELLLWDFLSADGESLNIEFSSEELAAKETVRLAERIEEQYGIAVFYGSAGNDFQSDDYLSKTVSDPFTVLNAVRIISEALDIYPAGMVSELCTGSVKNIEIYLSGTLYSITSSGINTAVGLTYTSLGTRVIVVDISYSLNELNYTLFHELMHLADDVIGEAESESGTPYLSVWEALVPAGFDYYYSYHDSYGDQVSDNTYTLAEENPDRIWFVDAYSKTFPTEDRARVFEYLMRGVLDGEDFGIRGEHLQYKARYLCAVLRECFDCLDGADELPWEAGLGKIDIGEFADMYN